MLIYNSASKNFWTISHKMDCMPFHQSQLYLLSSGIIFLRRPSRDDSFKKCWTSLFYFTLYRGGPAPSWWLTALALDINIDIDSD